MNYKVKITRFDEYEVSVDTSIWDKEALTHWSKHMFEVESVEDLIEPFILDFQNHEITITFFYAKITVQTWVSKRIAQRNFVA